jgi:hypothetical protein
MAEKRAELTRVVINETSDQQIIVIKERDGLRHFPIVIGIAEIFAIDRRLKGLKAPRPMTHDLIDRVIDALGARIEKVVINDLRNHTFFAKIQLKSNRKTVEIDCRPSDAIALGIACEAPIYVAEHVFEKASQ